MLLVLGDCILIYLAIGLLLWAFTHLIPSLLPSFKQSVVEKIGLGPYKGLFSLLIVFSIVLMVQGWKTTTPDDLYHISNTSLRILILVFIILGLLLFTSARYPNRVKQWIRHPQLTGLIIWAIAHLLLNGDNRSVLLFSGLIIWAIAEIIFINRREGQWIKPDQASVKIEMIGLSVSCIAIGILIYAHEYITGIPLL